MIGQTLAHFRITAKLGEGGMGEVYRAEDTKLGREVAIKVLPEAVTADAERLARFEREARVLAAVNHPNIAGIYEVGKAPIRRDPSTTVADAPFAQDDTSSMCHFLVMELAEGEDLGALLERGRMPLERALDLAGQIAAALEVAHEKGIVHRDLKPANIKVTSSGQVKVLDFGLAKALEEPASPDVNLTHSPTLTAQMTQAGMILGTAAYMSPEQARGQEVDKRSDIWSYGVVLYEMVSGERGFAADTVQDTLAKVLTTQPDLEELPGDTPPGLARLLERCLDPDPTTRLRDIGEARIRLQRLDESPAESLVPTVAPSPISRLTLAVAAAAIGALAVLAAWWLAPGPPEAPVRKLALDTGSIEAVWDIHPLISPDGSRILYGMRGKLWVQNLSELEARELPGSFNARYPSWSPDSRQVAFEARGRLWRSPVDGGSAVPVAPFPSDFGGSGASAWLTDGTIVISGGERAGILSVPEQGGTFTPLRPLGADETDLHEMTVLPDGMTLLFVRHRKDPEGKTRLVDSIGALRDGVETEVLFLEGDALQSVAYSPSGHLLFSRGTGTPGVWAVAFDAATLETMGDPFLVAAQARLPSVSRDGTLLMVHGLQLPLAELVGVDRDGVVRWSSGHVQPGVEGPSLSPDGKTLAVSAMENNNWDVWLYDVDGPSRSRLTFDATVEGHAVWSPDGSRIVVDIADLHTLAELPRAGAEARHLVPGSQPDWSGDGEELLHTRFVVETPSWDLYSLSMTTETATPVLATPADELQPRLSPDGSLLAYLSNESGEFEVYVQTHPDGDSRVQVSTAGGAWPVWRGDGGALFFVVGDDLVEVPIEDRERLAVGRPQVLFSLESAGFDLGIRGFAVSPDGETFYLPRQVHDPARRSNLVLVENWAGEFATD